MKNNQKWQSIFAKASILACTILMQISAIRGEHDEEVMNPQLIRYGLANATINIKYLAKKSLVEANIAWHEAWIRNDRTTGAQYFLDFAVRLGNQEAVMRYISGISEGIYGFQISMQSIIRSRMLNDVLVNLGNPKAIRRAIYGYSYQILGYERDLAYARELIEEYAGEGHEWAIKLKLTGSVFGLYGMNKDKEGAIAWNSERIVRGDKEALKRMVDDYGLIHNFYGYDYNPTEAKRLITLYAEHGEEWALKRMTIGYSTGTYGFEVNQKMAKLINNRLVKMRNKSARKRAVIGYIWGCYGYSKNINQGYKLARKWHIHDFGQEKYYQASHSFSTE